MPFYETTYLWQSDRVTRSAPSGKNFLYILRKLHGWIWQKTYRRGGERERQRDTEREYGIKKFYSVRPQPLLKWCKLNTLFNTMHTQYSSCWRWNVANRKKPYVEENSYNNILAYLFIFFFFYISSSLSSSRKRDFSSAECFIQKQSKIFQRVFILCSQKQCQKKFTSVTEISVVAKWT